MKYVSHQIVKSSKYGEMFAEVLATSKSQSHALHIYTVMLRDLLYDDHRKAALCMVARHHDDILQDEVLDTEDSYTADEVLEMLERLHPYRLEALISNQYLQEDLY